MSKRIKSFLITASSVLGTALLAVVLTPQWADFVHFANNKLVGLGVPMVVVSLLGVLVSEVWKQILNNRKLAQFDGPLGSSKQMMDLY